MSRPSLRPSLRLAGGDVRLVRRRADGRVVVAFAGTGELRAAWPHELRGIGWHLAEIKRLIAHLPLALPAGGATTPDATQTHEPQPRPLLFAHHVAAHHDDD